MTEQLISTEGISVLPGWVRVKDAGDSGEMKMLAKAYGSKSEKNPRQGFYSAVVYEGAIEPNNPNNIFARSQKRLSSWRPDPIADKLIDRFRKIENRAADPEYRRQFLEFVYSHEETHQIQSIRVNAGGLIMWGKSHPELAEKAVELEFLVEAQAREIQFEHTKADDLVRQDFWLWEMGNLLAAGDIQILRKMRDSLRTGKETSAYISILPDMIIETGNANLVEEIKIADEETLEKLAIRMRKGIERVADGATFKPDRERSLRIDGKIMDLSAKIRNRSI